MQTWNCSRQSLSHDLNTCDDYCLIYTGFDSLTGVTLETDYYDERSSYDNTCTLRAVSAAMASTSSNDSGFIKDNSRFDHVGYCPGGNDRRKDKGDRTPTAGTHHVAPSSKTPTSSGRIGSSNKKKPTISSALKVIKKATSKDLG